MKELMQIMIVLGGSVYSFFNFSNYIEEKSSELFHSFEYRDFSVDRSLVDVIMYKIYLSVYIVLLLVLLFNFHPILVVLLNFPIYGLFVISFPPLHKGISFIKNKLYVKEKREEEEEERKKVLIEEERKESMGVVKIIKYNLCDNTNSQTSYIRDERATELLFEKWLEKNSERFKYKPLRKNDNEYYFEGIIKNISLHIVCEECYLGFDDNDGECVDYIDIETWLQGHGIEI